MIFFSMHGVKSLRTEIIKNADDKPRVRNGRGTIVIDGRDDEGGILHQTLSDLTPRQMQNLSRDIESAANDLEGALNDMALQEIEAELGTPAGA